MDRDSGIQDFGVNLDVILDVGSLLSCFNSGVQK